MRKTWLCGLTIGALSVALVYGNPSDLRAQETSETARTGAQPDGPVRELGKITTIEAYQQSLITDTASRVSRFRSRTVDSYFFANSQLSYTFRNPYLPESGVRLFVFATNIFNNFYEEHIWRSAGGGGTPRKYGIGMEVKY